MGEYDLINSELARVRTQLNKENKKPKSARDTALFNSLHKRLQELKRERAVFGGKHKPVTCAKQNSKPIAPAKSDKTITNITETRGNYISLAYVKNSKGGYGRGILHPVSGGSCTPR